MSKKIFVKGSDNERVLFTEVLPYELPLIFSNERFYYFLKSLKKNESVPSLIKKIISDKREYTIPFEYQINQGINKKRKLHLIHPYHQIQFVDFYKNYNQIILSLCKRSPYSLRSPSIIASNYYESDYANLDDDELKTTNVDQEPDPFGEQTKYSSSYFYYARYSQLYRFIDSAEFLELEAKFNRLTKTDISKCFPSIYTHSISWAVKSKFYAKKHKSAFSFEGNFDKLMSELNYSETNGIVVGPEFSRIFSEIILQRIDLDVKKAISDADIKEHEYAIRRFVDDFFIFSNSETVTKRVFEIIEESLASYKLYLNVSKTETLSLPFITNQTIVKTDIRQILHQSVLKWLNSLKKICLNEFSGWDARDSDLMKLPYKTSLELIKNLKMAVKRADESFSVVSSPALLSITRSIYGLLKTLKINDIDEKNLKHFQDILAICIEVVFFFYPMDFRVRTTYSVAHFMILISRLTKSHPNINEYLVRNIKGHIDRVIGIVSKDRPGIELLNLLIAMREIYPEHLINSDILIKIIDPKFKVIEGNVDGLFANSDYFNFISLLYYFGNISDYLFLKDELIKEIKGRVNSANLIHNAEVCYMFIDFVSCPLIPDCEKDDLISNVFLNVFNKIPNQSEIGFVRNYCAKKLSFTDWKMQIGIEKTLQKKQLSPVY